jgi:RHS repeat-associated protein
MRFPSFSSERGFSRMGPIVLALLLFALFPGSAQAAPAEIPRTGQIQAFAWNDDGHLQAGVPWTAPRFTAGGGVVTDNLTGLTWLRNANCIGTAYHDQPPYGATGDGLIGWEAALTFVNGLNNIQFPLCGGGAYTDWRLPNINELASLIHYGQIHSQDWLNTQGFSNFATTYPAYISSTHAAFNNSFWTVDFSSNSTGATIYNALLIPVRGPTAGGLAPVPRTGVQTSYRQGDDGWFKAGTAWPVPRFQLIYGKADGICSNPSADCDGNPSTDLVVDHLSGLTWSRNANLAGPQTWYEAVALANDLQLGGLTDWRLPNIRELESLIDYSRAGPALPAGHPFVNVPITDPDNPFVNWTRIPYWSATTWAWFNQNAQVLNLGLGGREELFESKTGCSGFNPDRCLYYWYAWPVRGGITNPAERYPVDLETFLGLHGDVPRVSDPVHAGIGNYVFHKLWFGFPGPGLPFALETTYNSRDAGYNGPLGYGWTHKYNIFIISVNENGVDYTDIKWGDGHRERFTRNAQGDFEPQATLTYTRLTELVGGGWEAALSGGTVYVFDGQGRLGTIRDRYNSPISLSYSTRLDRITDTAGRQIVFNYVDGRLSSVTSPWKSGNTLAFQYDGAGNLTASTDPRGEAWTFTYDGSHRLLSHTDARGKLVVGNTYDDQGRVSLQEDGLQQQTAFAWTTDPQGTRVSITPPGGQAASQVYDESLNLVEAVDGEGFAARFSYDGRGNRTGFVNKGGRMASFLYDDTGRPTDLGDTQGVFERYVYAANQVEIKNGLNQSLRFTLDGQGNPVSITNPLGAGSDFTFNSSGQVSRFTDLSGGAWLYAYDSVGQLESLTDPLGNRKQFAYDPAGRLTRFISPDPNVSWQYTYDEGGNLLSATDPLGQVTASVNDQNGNLIRRTFQPLSATTIFTYDDLGRPTEITDATGRKSFFHYDQAGNLQQETDGDGVSRFYQYDRRNLAVGVSNGAGELEHFSRDADGQVLGRENALNASWSYTYDGEGRMLTARDPSLALRQWDYDLLGRPVAYTDPLGRTTRQEYDAAGRLIRLTRPDGLPESYEYNAADHPVKFTDPEGSVWRWGYDLLGRLTAATFPDGLAESYQYDSLNRMTRRIPRAGQALDFSYDRNSRLTGLTLPGGVAYAFTYNPLGSLQTASGPGTSLAAAHDPEGRRLSFTDTFGRTLGYAYTPGGRLASITYPGAQKVEYGYDALGRLASVLDWRNNRTQFSYDALGRVTQIDFPNGTRTRYAYDLINRIIGLTHEKIGEAPFNQYSFEYDGSGRLTREVREREPDPGPLPSTSTQTVDVLNRLLSSTREGRLTTCGYNLNGSRVSAVTGGETVSFTYDSLERLTGLTGDGHSTTYAYDPLGNRISLTFDGSEFRYLVDSGRVYMRTLPGTDGVWYDVHAGGKLLYSLRENGALTVYHGDQRGSVTAVSDASGVVTNSYIYDPYGLLVGSQGSADNPYRFLGQWGVMSDPNGFYHLGARYYDPRMQRFLTLDPIGLTGGVNLYAYAGGDPINRVDPSGYGWLENFFGAEKAAEMNSGGYNWGGGSPPAPQPVPEGPSPPVQASPPYPTTSSSAITAPGKVAKARTAYPTGLNSYKINHSASGGPKLTMEEVDLIRQPYRTGEYLRPGAGELNYVSLPGQSRNVLYNLNKNYAIQLEMTPPGQPFQPNFYQRRPLASGGGRILGVAGTAIDGGIIAYAGYEVGRTYSSQAPLVYDPKTGTWGTLDDYYTRAYTPFWRDYYYRDELNWDKYYHQKWQGIDGLNGGRK